MGKWISVEDRLPDNGADVLAYADDGEESRIIPSNYDRGTWFDCCFNCANENITHWMPLPTPPKP